MRGGDTVPVLLRINSVSQPRVLAFDATVIFERVLRATRVIPFFFTERWCWIPSVLMRDRGCKVLARANTQAT